MKPIEYPSKGTKEFADLVNDYVSIFATDLADKVTKRGRKRLGLESKWKNWKRKYGCIRVLNNSVADLLTMDFEDLALFYEAFLRVCSKRDLYLRVYMTYRIFSNIRTNMIPKFLHFSRGMQMN